jgi:4-deoxy-L-threo-5-hexosulose-uronate ketol-isomerase
MKLIQVADQVRYRQMSTAELRQAFLIEDLFTPGTVTLVYLDLDRAVVGSAVPLASPLSLPTPHLLRATCFTERRELGVLNIGAPGSVTVDGASHDLDRLDALYIGRGDHSISFSSADSAHPAEFYLLSYPAHSTHPTEKIQGARQPAQSIGAAETANRRSITRLIHLEGTRSCQLVMGYTRLEQGSVWNTMPPHTHMRRSEIYLYFDLDPQQRIVHLMGPPQETRHLVVSNRQAVISPGWSIHAGVGTSSYTFCWGMGGENQVYSDMDALQLSDLL